jgi:hypothetical protein
MSSSHRFTPVSYPPHSNLSRGFPAPQNRRPARRPHTTVQDHQRVCDSLKEKKKKNLLLRSKSRSSLALANPRIVRRPPAATLTRSSPPVPPCRLAAGPRPQSAHLEKQDRRRRDLAPPWPPADASAAASTTAVASATSPPLLHGRHDLRSRRLPKFPCPTDASLSRLRPRQHWRLLPPRAPGKGPMDVRDA